MDRIGAVAFSIFDEVSISWGRIPPGYMLTTYFREDANVDAMTAARLPPRRGSYM